MRAGSLLMPEPAEETSLLDRFKIIGAADFGSLPTLGWHVKRVFPREGLGAIFGPSGSGKSFLAADLIAALTSGEDWFGHRVKACRVLYLVLEGEAGFRRRIEAWEKANDREFPESARFVFDRFRITDQDDVLGLAAAIVRDGDAEFIVVDTLNRASDGADENSSADMGRILEGARKLQLMTGSLVLLVHHSGKNLQQGMRGHSSLLAALDVAIEVQRTGDAREWRVAKAKDCEDGAAHQFRLALVDLGNDADGEPITSCVVKPDNSPVVIRPKAPTGGNQKIVFDALGPMFKAAHNRGRAGAPPTRPCITVDEAVAGTKDKLPVVPLRGPERARTAITGLIARGLLATNEGWLWLV